MYGLLYETLLTSKTTDKPTFIIVGHAYQEKVLGVDSELIDPNSPINLETKKKLKEITDTISLTK